MFLFNKGTTFTVTRLQAHSTIPAGNFRLDLGGGLVTPEISPFGSFTDVLNAIDAVSKTYNVI